MTIGTDLRRKPFRLTLLAGLLALILAPATGTAQAGMKTGDLTSQPIGHYDFCRQNAAECSIRPRDTSLLALTPAMLKRIRSVNAMVNAEVKPMSDLEIYGREEVWAYPDLGVGDCEDYALEKRRRLNRSGISLANLLMTVVRKPDGEGHAVLTVRTDKGDLILDNLSDEVRSWRATPYKFLKRQAHDHTGRWVDLKTSQDVLVGSVN